MSKSRRQRAHNRKLEALHHRAEELITGIESRLSRHYPEKTPLQLEIERKISENLKSELFTPEYMQAWQETTDRIALIGHQLHSLNGRLRHQIEQRRPAGLGSYRTKRLRKKMQTYKEKELRARGLWQD